MSHISYEELKKLASYGIFAMKFKGTSVSDKRLDKCEKIKRAEHNGIYTGSPGKDIYYMLPYLNEEQMKEIVEIIVDKFPKDPPGNHVNVGAFIRFIYGQFEKQGILRSEQDFERMKKEKLDWKLSRKFIELLYEELEKNNNYYGLSILCEMEGHRLGDEAVINKDGKKIKEMEDKYNKSVDFAYECMSYKQLFTPYYWLFRYFEKFGDKEKPLFYAYKTFEQANKYCPDDRHGYVDKLFECMIYIKKNDKKSWKGFYDTYKKSKNKCVKKVLKNERK